MIDAEPLFGVPWDRIDLADVKALLAEGQQEGLLWEAKGTTLKRGEVREQLCGFANSHDGGFLILGARWDEGAKEWVVDGVEFPDEPPTWMTNQANSVRPRPVVDTRCWPTTGERMLAITRVEPVPNPPCNAHGVVYERVSGATLSVRDPQRLAELFRRGEAAREAAQGNADRIAAWAMGELGRWFAYDDETPVASLAAAHLGTAADISKRLFAPHFVQHFEATATGLPNGAALPQAVEWTQQGLKLPVTGQERGDRSGVVFATWQGVTAVAFLLAGIKDPDPHRFVDAHLRAALRTADVLQLRLGGFGELFVTIFIRPRAFRASRSIGPSGLIEIRHGPLPQDYDRGLRLASIERELLRAGGQQAFETG